MLENIVSVGVQFIGRIALAIIIWVVARLLIRFAVDLAHRTLDVRKTDATVTRYLCSMLDVVLNIVLVIALLGYFGLETTTFAALLAGAGLAIGAALSGLLAHFAAGLFLLVLRPFKVGDFISAGGVTGTVKEIGLFSTSINTPDNILTFVGNSTILGGNIQNFSANPYRRVLLPAQIAHNVDHKQVIQMLEEHGKQIANVLSDPAPSASISELKAAGPVVTLALFCHNSDYWQVYFDGNRMIRETFTEAGFPVPQETIRVMNTNP
jgi:small conductance mechanosensitive channel